MGRGSWFARLSGGQPEDGGPVQASAGSATWAQGQLVLDDFEVERALGEGGMGTVYLVRSRSTGQRFAVKRAKLRDPASQRNFLAELQTWVDLPEYPHLVACRFFRTVGDEVAIFAEYVEGGSLSEWIREGKLATLPEILDVAIQFAWGLAAAHELGLVHQDVKPGNLLLTADGLAKVTDFGLARARAAAGERAAGRGQGVLVSAGGMTPAYCSPEQAAGQPLSHRTDIWSWAVSVLEMFVGEVTWLAGQVAPEALAGYLETGPEDKRLPPMPAGVAALLRSCFQTDPARRPPSMAKVAEDLQRCYRQAVGSNYPRRRPALPAPSTRQAVVHDRRTIMGTQWDDPRQWLAAALRAAGREEAEAEALAPPRTGSRQAQAIADLAAYQEACRIFEGLVAGGRRELRVQLALIYTAMATVHQGLEDIPGALALCQQVIEIYEHLVNQEGQGELANALASAYLKKAGALWAVHECRAAIALHDQAIEIRERLVNREGRRELADYLANTYLNKASALESLGDYRAAVALNEQAIEIYERLVKQEGRQELANELARVYVGKASAVRALGEHRAAVGLQEQAIAIYERLVNREGRRELAGSLADAYLGKGSALHTLGDYRAAIALYDQAIEIRERLVNREGRRELADYLANAYLNKAAAVTALGDKRAPVALYERAIAIYERLVNQEGRRELAHELAGAYLHKGSSVLTLGDHRAAVALYDQAIGIYERLVNQEGRRELTGEAAWGKAYRAAALAALGDHRRARSEAREAVAVLEAEVARTGRADHRTVLDWARSALKEVL